jgi:hypothetical protein
VRKTAFASARIVPCSIIDAALKRLFFASTCSAAAFAVLFFRRRGRRTPAPAPDAAAAPCGCTLKARAGRFWRSALACNRRSRHACGAPQRRNFATVSLSLRDVSRINRHGMPAPSWRLAFYVILSNLIQIHFVIQVKQVLPHNLMCNPLTGQAVSRKVKQPANLAKREER